MPNDQLIQDNGFSGAGANDVNNTLKSVVQQLGALATSTATDGVTTALGVLATATLGANIGTTTSPAFTNATVGTSSVLVIAANSSRLNIAFHSPNPSAPNMWVSPATAVAGQGVLVLPGGTVLIPSTCTWFAIATSGSSNALTVLEWK